MSGRRRRRGSAHHQPDPVFAVEMDDEWIDFEGALLARTAESERNHLRRCARSNTEALNNAKITMRRTRRRAGRRQETTGEYKAPPPLGDRRSKRCESKDAAHGVVVVDDDDIVGTIVVADISSAVIIASTCRWEPMSSLEPMSL